MTDLDTRVRQAFDNVTVPDDVKRGTLTYIAVSYTHLDVYKRQLPRAPRSATAYIDADEHA